MKQQRNKTGLRIKFIAPTNTQEFRVKFTQLNNNKNCVKEIPDTLSSFEYVCEILEKLDIIKSFHSLIDNTGMNSSSFTFVVEIENSDSFVDLIEIIKGYEL